MLLSKNMFFVTLLIFVELLVVPSLGITGFRNDKPVDLRRQIPFPQETPLLTDVPQNRFIPLPSTAGFRQIQNEFVQQPSLELNPVQFSPNSQQFGIQQQQQYRPIIQQSPRALSEPEIFNSNNQQFVDNSKQFLPIPPSQPGINYQQGIQENYFPQPQFSNVQPSNQIPLQTQPNHQLPVQHPTLHSFLPTIPTDSSNGFSQNSQIPTNNLDSSHANILASNPLFSNTQSTQLRTLLDDQRKQDLERLKDLQERQKIIQKHKQYLERQQQKQQQKVQKLHEEFLAKQKKKQEDVYATTRSLLEVTSSNPITGREIYPHELSLFEKAIQQNTKPTTTAPEPATTKKSITRGRSRQRSKSKVDEEISDTYVQSNKQKNYKQGKSSSNEDSDKGESKLQYVGRQELLKQLKLALVENSNDINVKNFSSREIALPNGEKFEVIKTSDPNLIAGATPLANDGSPLSQIFAQNQLIRKSTKSPKISFEDLTKDVIPPGADFEVIKQTGNGKLEEVEKIPSNLSEQKKVTFVFIEEQNDGSYKVKGVKGTDDSNNSPNPDVENVIKKIKDGQIKFPTVQKQPELPSSTRAPFSSTREAAHVTRSGSSYSKSTSRKPTNNYHNFEATKISSTTPKYYNSPSPSSLSINHNGSPSPSSSDNYDSSSKYSVTTPSSTAYYKSTHNDKYSEGTPSYDTFSTMVNGHQMHSTRYDSSTASSPKNIDTSIYSQTPDLAAATSSSFTKDDLSIISSSSTYYPNTNIVSRSTTSKPSLEEASSQIALASSVHPGLIEILKDNGLFAAAKYIRQSGLDTILNETGPYTVFAPTDKAFRTLLIQLGGPDKAEEKFKENPRLLSGLLLHHIIPGAFEITSLQDEMTGVSLAGTQLRVNQYDMHDVEWNEIKVTTINGARVLNEKQDIRIPQGIAHAVDRVMFPLPVGDIVQTLQADRERRFNNFLKALFNSGMVEALSDSRTYTVFAPVDKAFSSLSTEELQQLVSDKERSKELVTRHIAPGTLFSAGMRYYQIRDTMAQEKPITLQKNAGRIKVNSGHVITHNIPATNGVIHAVDMLL